MPIQHAAEAFLAVLAFVADPLHAYVVAAGAKGGVKVHTSLGRPLLRREFFVPQPQWSQCIEWAIAIC